MLTAQVEIITPEKANEYLERNTANYRKLSMARVLPMAEDMRKGRWQLNGETIVFGMNGTLKDGQHRLKAIAESGVAVPVLVAREVDDNVDIFDCGGGQNYPAVGKRKGAVSINASGSNRGDRRQRFPGKRSARCFAGLY